MKTSDKNILLLLKDKLLGLKYNIMLHIDQIVLYVQMFTWRYMY